MESFPGIWVLPFGLLDGVMVRKVVPMKRTLLAVFVSTLALALNACGGTNDTPQGGGSNNPHTTEGAPPSPWKPLSELPADYGPSQALIDGVVTLCLNQTGNQDLMTSFYANVEDKKPAFMRVLHCTTEGDSIIADYYYDTTGFTVNRDNTRDRFSRHEDRAIHTREFLYLIPDPEYPGFLLTNSETITEDNREDTWVIPSPN